MKPTSKTFGREEVQVALPELSRQLRTEAGEKAKKVMTVDEALRCLVMDGGLPGEIKLTLRFSKPVCIEDVNITCLIGSPLFTTVELQTNNIQPVDLSAGDTFSMTIPTTLEMRSA